MLNNKMLSYSVNYKGPWLHTRHSSQKIFPHNRIIYFLFKKKIKQTIYMYVCMYVCVHVRVCIYLFINTFKRLPYV